MLGQLGSRAGAAVGRLLVPGCSRAAVGRRPLPRMAPPVQPPSAAQCSVTDRIQCFRVGSHTSVLAAVDRSIGNGKKKRRRIISSSEEDEAEPDAGPQKTTADTPKKR